MKVIVAIVIAAVIGLLVYAQSKPQVLHAKPSNGQVNGFATSEAAQKMYKLNALKNTMRVARGPIDSRLTKELEQTKAELASLEKTKQVAIIDPKTDLKFVGFYSTDTSRTLRWNLAKTTQFARENTEHFIRVKLPDGREYFMSMGALQEPRPHLSREPGQ